MSAELENSRARRPRPEGRTIYRPGSGPLKKSSNVENIQPNSSQHSANSGGDVGLALASSLRNVTLKCDSGAESKHTSSRNDTVSDQRPRSKKYSTQRPDRETYQPKSDGQHHSKASTEQRDVQGPKSKTLSLDKPDGDSVQDLRQLILEKRSQRSNNDSPSSTHREHNSTNRSQSDQRNNSDSRLDRQSAMKNGVESRSDAHSTNGEPSGTVKSNERRGGSARFKNDRRPPRVESSRSDGHLSALATNPTSGSNRQPARSNAGSDRTLSGPNEGGRNGPNEREKREGHSHRRKRRNGNHRGSRRGSVSSDTTATTPVPEPPSSWADEPRSRPGSRRSRHASSPYRSHSRNDGEGDGGTKPVSPSNYTRQASSVTSPLPTPGRQISEHPTQFSSNQRTRPPIHNQSSYGRDQRSSDYPGGYRSHGGGRPPSGRGGRANLIDSLPPRLRKKYEEERMHQSLPANPTGVVTGPPATENEWDGGSLTFVSHGASRFPPSSQWSSGGGSLRGGSGPSRFSPAGPADHDDLDPILVCPRSQEGSLTGAGLAIHSRERKTSFNDSRSSTPSSNVETTIVQSFARGALRRLDEINGAQTSLDWSEEMEEEDRRSLAEEPKPHYNYYQTPRPQQQQQQQRPAEPSVNFASADVRYKNKPAEGYVVLPSSNGGEVRQLGNAASHPPAGRPLFGQGRKPEQTPVPRFSVPGLIQLPAGPLPPAGPPPAIGHQQPPRHSPRRPEGPSYRERRNSNNSDSSRNYRQVPGAQQRTLFDPANPHKPIVVAQRDDTTSHHVRPRGGSPLLGCPEAYLSLPADHGTGTSKPAWYDPNSDSFRDSKSEPNLLLDIARCDAELTRLLHGPNIFQRFQRIQMNRKFLQDSLRVMLTSDLRFCQNENVEQHIWKTAFHNVIEALRKGMAEEPEAKEDYRTCLYTVIDEGCAYFESLMETLQEAHHFVLEPYLEPQAFHSLSGLRYVGLAVISCQKILVFLGDLARYREMTAETSNYGKAKSWYTKANHANPKNGRPYNQLAILALYARRKLDAVYLYMRSLMASNPFQSARESLVSLFDENRKKYEQQERKRREAKEATSQRLRETTASSEAGVVDRRRGLRREIWVHPQDGRRTRRTTSTGGSVGDSSSSNAPNSDDEELAQLPSIEVNKRFVTSYLNVQGKLYTKIGMESFQECGLQMLREFRALLLQTPLPVNQSRLLQLLALNMFAVSNTQLKDSRMADGCRSAWQECALIVSLEMFNVLLERCNAMLKEQVECGQTGRRLLGEDLQIIFPAVKVWCDWLLCHSAVWNPPPTSRDYHVGPPGTPWMRLAVLFNLLSRLDTRQVEITTEPKEGYQLVKLPEDVYLCGFTPLMVNIQDPHYTPKSSDMDMAADCVRIERMLYFGRDILCGLDPPVLKLKFIGPSLSEYVCLVDGNGSAGGSGGNTITGHHQQLARRPGGHPEDDISDEDEALLNELDREEEEEEEGDKEVDGSIRELRQRKDELTQKHLDQQRRKEQLRAILRERLEVELEVRPKLLVADTNCYIDHSDALGQLIRHQKHFTLIVPLVVLKELEGLCRSRLEAEARSALSFLREKSPQIRYVTSKGAPLPALACTMSEADNDDQQALTNDDRILQCCLSLIKASDDGQCNQDGVRRLRREVVLLTKDRNLRVKALARDVPVRDLPAFLSWSSMM